MGPVGERGFMSFEELFCHLWGGSNDIRDKAKEEVD
jgi:hypothetical protein